MAAEEQAAHFIGGKEQPPSARSGYILRMDLGLAISRPVSIQRISPDFAGVRLISFCGCNWKKVLKGALMPN